MKFGKIDYLNLLPFDVFLKKSSMQSYIKMATRHKNGVPSAINKALLNNKVDAAIISSVKSTKKVLKTLDFGIVAKGSVKSVLVRKNSPQMRDFASASSNVLAKILGINGEVIIGDRALKSYLDEGSEKFYDLAQIWHEKKRLPFVFARFSYRKNGKTYKKIVKNFLRQKVKIPNYILSKYVIKSGICASDIMWYLNFISYKIGKKEKKSLQIFLANARKFNIK